MKKLKKEYLSPFWIRNKLNQWRFKFKRKKRRHSLTPGFYTQLCMRKRIHHTFRDRNGFRQAPVYPFETKSGQKAMAEKAGIACSRTLQGPFSSSSEFDFDHLPSRFCLKPDWGAASKGVLLVEQNGTSLRDLRTQKRIPKDASVLDTILFEWEAERYGVFAEELLESRGLLPHDFKLYSFYGEVGLITQIDRSEKLPRFKYYDTSGKTLGYVSDRRIDKKLPEPECLPAMVDAASRISTQLPTPFIRVDLYEVGGTIFFGETALRPGNSQIFSPALDLKLGKMWEDASVRLIDRFGEQYIP